MAANKVSDEAVMGGLLRVFQDYGYEGATLARISEATGLEKSSLYHRFPGGKDEMAILLLRQVGARFANEILAPLRRSEAMEVRIRKCAIRLRRFYEAGRRSCVLDTLSLCGGDPRIHMEVKAVYLAWQGAFAEITREAGIGQAAAVRRAQEAIGAIHGALVLARATGNRGPFEGVLTDLPKTLTQKEF
jgi:AcrR family transcriptional regulator